LDLAKEDSMGSNTDESPCRSEDRLSATPSMELADADIRLSRWLVSFASGAEWYPVGEYVALDSAAAIERAVEIFGGASDYRAEEIPWDAAPLPRARATTSAKSPHR
jgi:hypothetical protein